MSPLRNITFVILDFGPGTPAQQLLDRFLIGYPCDGKFHRLEGCRITVHLASPKQNTELERREKDFGLAIEPGLEKAVASADAVVVVGNGVGENPDGGLLRKVLEAVPPRSRCFVHGLLGLRLDEAKELTKAASARQVSLAAGTSTAVTWRLPAVDLPLGTHLQNALIIVQGTSPVAELHGLEGLLPVIERRRGGEPGVRQLRCLEGNALWQAGEEGIWSKGLLAAAISRSNNPQGDSVTDGRTQDLVGLGLVNKLARDPRGWVIDHRDGLRSAILVLDGVVADFNFAVAAREGTIVSAQLYRPPAPAEHHYTRLAAVMEEFFRTGNPPWSAERNLLIAGLLEAFSKAATSPGRIVETPDLDVSYSP